MIDVDVTVDDKRYYLRVWWVKRFCRVVVATAWQASAAEVSVVLTNDTAVRKLNKQYRKQDKPTNVLSFPMPRLNPVAPWLAGDIVLAYETVARETKEQGKSFKAHLAHLLIHGALHLQGLDHMNAKQAGTMEKKETALMRQLGYPNPYQETR